MTPGLWHVLLGPYMIVPPGTPYEVTVTLHFGKQGPAFVPRPAPRRVKGTGPGWYRGDLHLHTLHSDGKRTQPEMIKAARQAGLDFINSSDHNTSAAQLYWGRHTPDDFLVISGEEVTTRDGHWLAVGLPAGSWIDWRYVAADAGRLTRFTDQVRGLGGMAIAAHPFNPLQSIRWGYGYDYADLDAVEIWNGPWTGDDQTAVEHWHDLLVSGTYLPVVGNSDSHTPEQKVGLAQTIVRASTLSVGVPWPGSRAATRWRPSPRPSGWSSRRRSATRRPSAATGWTPRRTTWSTYASSSPGHPAAWPRSAARQGCWRARSPTAPAPSRSRPSCRSA